MRNLPGILARNKRRTFVIVGFGSAVTIFALGLVLPGSFKQDPHGAEIPVDTPADLHERPQLRPEPVEFKRNTYLPRLRERDASGPIDLASFSPGRSLAYVDDERVWWESDHDTGDIEDDHTVHESLVKPLRQLIELVDQHGALLKVQDTYRPAGIHSSRSLHKEGRAIDVTCDDMPLERLAKLCWAAGFDWVYYEANPRKGPHIHCSVRR